MLGVLAQSTANETASNALAVVAVVISLLLFVLLLLTIHGISKRLEASDAARKSSSDVLLMHVWNISEHLRRSNAPSDELIAERTQELEREKQELEAALVEAGRALDLERARQVREYREWSERTGEGFGTGSAGA